MIKGTLISGIAASEHLDSSGERISIKGLDISSLERGEGVLNYEHKNETASHIVGKIIKAKKIFSQEDCESQNELYFWKKSQAPFLYIVGELFDSVGHQQAKEIASILKYDSAKRAEDPSSKNVINFSIEGAKLEKNGSEITKSIARKTTLTVTPCNKMAIAEELKSEAPKEQAKKNPLDIFKTEENESIQILEKSELPEGWLIKVDAAPSTLIGTPALTREEIIKKKKAKIEESFKHWSKAEDLVRFFQKKNPNLTKTEAIALAKIAAHRFTEKAEHAIEKMEKSWKPSVSNIGGKQVVSFEHPQHGIVSVHEEGGKFHVKHAGALAGLKGQKGSFSSPHEAVAHAQNYTKAVSAGTTAPKTMTNIPSAQSTGSKIPAFAAKAPKAAASTPAPKATSSAPKKLAASERPASFRKSEDSTSHDEKIAHHKGLADQAKKAMMSSKRKLDKQTTPVTEEQEDQHDNLISNYSKHSENHQQAIRDAISYHKAKLLEMSKSEPLKKKVLKKSSDIWHHQGWNFKTINHPKTPAGHQTYHLIHKESGKTEQIFARSPQEVGKFIEGENLKMKKQPVQKSELQKGVMSRMKPFNPTAVPKEQREDLREWQSHGQDQASDIDFYRTPQDVRDRLEPMDPNARARGLHKLHSMTKVRKNPKTGEREFLLHRGTLLGEHNYVMGDDGVNYSYNNRSSWTPDHKQARGFTDPSFHTFGGENSDSDDEADRSPGHVISSWIPESKISHVPLQYGAVHQDIKPAKPTDMASLKIRGKIADPNANDYRNELEIIVEPHSGQHIAEASSAIFPSSPVQDINERISRRAQGESSQSLIATKHARSKGKLAASEPLMKPFRSEAQRRWAHTPKGTEALGGKKAVAHWDKETKGKQLPEKLGKKDLIPGGLSDKKDPKSFDPKAVKEGQKVEMEHTSSSKVAREIARDHLTEDKKYYKKLKTIEKK